MEGGLDELQCDGASGVCSAIGSFWGEGFTMPVGLLGLKGTAGWEATLSASTSFWVLLDGSGLSVLPDISISSAGSGKMAWEREGGGMREVG